MRKKLIFALLTVTGLLLITTGVVLGPYFFRVRHFKADPANGYHADFYLYSSPAAEKAVRNGHPATLLIQPNNSGTTSDDPAIHRKDAWWTGFGRSSLADDLGVILLVPAFIRPAEDWQIYTHALDRDALSTQRPDLVRIDLQLIQMIATARAALDREGVTTRSRFLLQGFSASGMFANRFAALHPDRVLAVATGSPGGWPLAPVSLYGNEALAYPIGVADLAELTGAAFDSVAYQAVPQLIVMGSLDDNDSLDFRDGWDEVPAALVDRLFGADPLSRWPNAEALYQAGGANARFVLVEGVGHDRRQLQEYSTEFFREILDRQAGGQ
jgi:pimeloyl-ACP methyl ester carboxylesterase